MRTVFVVRLRESLDEGQHHSEYNYPRAFRLQSSATDYILDLAKHLKKEGFTEVERTQVTPSSPVHGLKMRNAAGVVKTFALTAWDYQDN